MLVNVFRDGPLRHLLRKGYVVHAGDPAAVVQELLDRRPALPTLGGTALRLHTDATRPGLLWIDTGPVWISDPTRRSALRTALAEATAVLAQATAKHGGALVPAATVTSRDQDWLCEDRHGAEVIGDAHREVTANLLRRYVPELIALTGRSAPGQNHGSQRLADAADRLPARFIDSAQPLHLLRVTNIPRRDVDPIGGSDPRMDSVEVGCIDAQVFPAQAVAHAVLIHALAVKARRMARTGRRVARDPQQVHDRDRSAAIAWGLAAELSGDCRPAALRVRTMIRDLVPELRMMEVTADELMPLIGGLTLHAAGHREAARTENDLLPRRPGGQETLLSDATVLAMDHLTAANRQLAPGGLRTVRDHWASLLTDAAPVSAVSVVLDLRDSRYRPPAAARELVTLWSTVETALAGRSLSGQTTVGVELPDGDSCVLWVTDPDTAPAVVTPDLSFSLRGVLERDTVRYPCTQCQKAGDVSYAPFVCFQAEPGDQQDRLCDRHAILVGDDRAFCPAHAPYCGCGERARFWCHGPQCKGRIAHCGQHRRRHPGDLEFFSCLDCHDEVFAACAVADCTATGTVSCDFVSGPALLTCGRRACAGHGMRWRLHSTDSLGLGLCPDHGLRLRDLTDHQLVFQIVAATAGSGRPELPSLRNVGQALMSVRGDLVDAPVLDGWLTALEHELGDSPRETTMRSLLRAHAPQRRIALDEQVMARNAGHEHVEKLRSRLRAMGLTALADAVLLAEFLPGRNVLYVHVPAGLRGQFIGREGSRVRLLSSDLGVTIRMEGR
ncbi:KH domain-containing protein [Actinoplanes xinjiangensis]|uniref:Uncharacterized protein n=1 Tax=Actinoplanes xinjiangensis TaxID=512350 RepID=A0A316EP37_9ACTN|nr:KH domain-containing protein [Actinoplanes xinjiangensis]PWK33230.1 hypothetical protein BC793_12820 [Actinoplanes xinjiangensis]GIF43531.1 hypothetical protein Axi01nite_78420 [Actinoplanes xinjiangensis]